MGELDVGLKRSSDLPLTLIADSVKELRQDVIRRLDAIEVKVDTNLEATVAADERINGRVKKIERWQDQQLTIEKWRTSVRTKTLATLALAASAIGGLGGFAHYIF